mgnify:CR=1 FL=1
MLSKIVQKIKTRQSELVLILAVVLIAVIAFESGRISALRKFDAPLEIKYAPAAITGTESTDKTKPETTQYPQKLDLRVVASKNSTLYHFLWCSGAQRIKEENKITFSSEQEAQSKGYKLASNCQR